MARRVIGRTKEVTIADSTDETNSLVFEIRGLSASEVFDMATIGKEKGESAVIKHAFQKAVVRVVEGLVDDEDKVIKVKQYNLADVLDVREAAELLNEINEHSNLTTTEKKG